MNHLISLIVLTCMPKECSSKAEIHRCFPENFMKFIRAATLWHTREWLLPRSRHQRCSLKKGALKNFAKLLEKHLY